MGVGFAAPCGGGQQNCRLLRAWQRAPTWSVVHCATWRCGFLRGEVTSRLDRRCRLPDHAFRGPGRGVVRPGRAFGRGERRLLSVGAGPICRGTAVARRGTGPASDGTGVARGGTGPIWRNQGVPAGGTRPIRRNRGVADGGDGPICRTRGVAGGGDGPICRNRGVAGGGCGPICRNRGVAGGNRRPASGRKGVEKGDSRPAFPGLRCVPPGGGPGFYHPRHDSLTGGPAVMRWRIWNTRPATRRRRGTLMC